MISGKTKWSSFRDFSPFFSPFCRREGRVNGLGDGIRITKREIARTSYPIEVQNDVLHLLRDWDMPWLSSSQVTGRVLYQRVSHIKETSRLSRFTFQNEFSTSWHNVVPDEAAVNRTYADFSIFKGKAALSVFPVLPKFSKMDSGALKIDRKGVVLLQFMPAIGVRKYDSQRKQVFALSLTEVGCLVSLGPQESCEFFHDPSMRSSNEGQVKKTLTVNPTPNDGGYFITLSKHSISLHIL
ncbi:hypothetical protein Taro_014797 [Colocasia esculenta]|uniref:Uncharacterized protein n=1 Tax=Colocasia esculenta TaxID=4460 RepID=A0A843UFY0_COLES|nr:hypothetical protein [Colocasia esculenta]